MFQTHSVPRPYALGLLFLVGACSSTTSSSAPPEQPPAASDGTTSTVREAFEFIAPCTSTACGEVPASSKATKPACRSSGSTCAWAEPSPDDTVSYRECAAKECGTKPDASVCPAGTTYKGSQCGSENDGACVWRSSCTPPPSTTPCPDADGCGGKPEIGVICSDGSTGDLVCMKQGASCGWQRTCE